MSEARRIDGFDVEREWVRQFWTDLEPHGTGAYVNFLMDEGPGRVRQAYGPQTLRRLRALKRRYDPDNHFHLNPNVDPNEDLGPDDKADAKPPKE